MIYPATATLFEFCTGFLHFDGSLEFREEPQVVLEIVTKVVDLPLEHRDALQAHSEGETAVLAAVDS